MENTAIKPNKENNIMKFLTILAIGLILSGLVIIFIPQITDNLYKQDVQEKKEEFFKKNEKEDQEAIDYLNEKLYNKLKEENTKLYQTEQKDLRDNTSYQQPEINLSDYGIAENTIGFLKIPKLDLEIPILLGANERNMKKGAVHLTKTSYPIGGKNTNSVIAAHRGYSKAQMFRHIDKLEYGDDVYIENFKEILNYKVTKIEIISPEDIEKILIQENKDLVTLITCHPYRINNKRYVVYCSRV